MVSAETHPDRQDLQVIRFEILSRIAGDLAHEIKNPVHSMLINLEVLKKRIASGATDVALERAAVLEHEVLRLHRLVDSLLRLLRPDTSAPQPIDAGSAIADLVPLLETQAKLARVEFHYDADGPVAPVCARRDDLVFAILAIAEPLLDTIRSAGGSMALTTDCEGDDVRIRIAVRRDTAAAAETTAAGQGIFLSPDPCAAAVSAAAELLRDAGGRVLRGDTEDPASHKAFLVVLPRCTRA